VRSAARTFLAAAPACSVIAVGWLSIEEPARAWSAAALVALAVAAALLPSWRLRAAGAAIGAVLAVRIAFGVWLPEHPIGALDRIDSHLGGGFIDFYATHLAFDPRAHAEMGALVLAAIFCFSLLAALLVAARRPVLAAVALLAGAGWPETLLRPDHGAVMGAAILLAGLALVAVMESRRVPSLGPALAAGVVLAAVAVGSATASNDGVLHWQQWNLASAGAPPSTGFVWDAQYNGLDWPSRPTVMLDVRSRTRPSYVRAAVLDDFTGDRWVTGPLRAADSLEPAEAFRSSRETRAVVTIHSLFDSRLPGGSVPIRFATDAPIAESVPGFASLPAGLDPGFRYTVWSYSPAPTSARLSRVPAVYPEELLDGGMLDTGDGVRVQPFGTPGQKTGLLRALDRSGSTRRYIPLARAAAQVTSGATSPYEAVLDLDRWFLLSGGFRYSNHPRVVTPPLVGFVTRTRSGYCQYFAGAMALMLRYRGIPARVAVGFAGPSYDRTSGTWVITDQDAHAWVEVWFRGYGWLPFDPTPALPGSNRSPLETGPVRQSSGGSTAPAPKVPPHTANAQAAQRIGGSALPGTRLGSVAGPTSTALNPGGGSLYALFLVLTVAAVVGLIAATKALVRLRSRFERDPRRVAAACREELAGFLLDQGINPAGSATLHELGEIARRRLGVDPQAFVAAASAARFGRIEHSAAAAHDTRRELRALLVSCRRFLTRPERLRGFISVRSLTRTRAAVDLSTPVGSGSA
jgi:transglutaminase-like putative cysteine protease